MHDNGLDTMVAGVRCREVLADLSEYMDCTLPVTRVQELRAHLAACDRCTRMGDGVSRLLTALREGLSTPPPLSDASAARLHAQVASAIRA